MTISIQLTGRGVEVTSSLRDYVNEKFSRLEKRGDHITSISVILGVEKLNQIAKGTLHVKGADLHAEAMAVDMYAAIDELVDKLNRQIVKHRDSTTSHH